MPRDGIDKTPQGYFRARVVINGERHSRNFTTKKAARQWIREAQVDAGRAKFVAPAKERERVSDRLDAWLELKASDPNFTDGSLKVYRRWVRNHIKPRLGHLRMEQLTPETVEEWRNSLVSDHGTSVAKECHKVLGSFLSTQKRHGYVVENAARIVEPPKHRPREMTFLEPHELKRVVEELADGPVHPRCPEDERELRSGWRQDVVLGLALIGCRVGDFSRLRPEDWDRVNDRLLVRDSKTENDRRIPVFPALREVLERCVARGGEHLFMTDGWHGQAIIRSQGFARRHFNPALERAEVGRHIRIHDLRHSCASWLIRQGYGPVHVAAYLGHANPSTTMRTYAHLFADDFADMGAALDEMWAKAHEAPGNVTRLRRPAE